MVGAKLPQNLEYGAVPCSRAQENLKAFCCTELFFIIFMRGIVELQRLDFLCNNQS